MRENYQRLGNYIQPVIGRNSDLGNLPLVGLSITKKFIPSIANTIGTDMSTYRTIYKNQFAYGPVTSRNGDKITIALFQDYEKALISQAYIPFEVKDSNKLLPEYLMMWFGRPEFDRYARFMSHGSAREIFAWEDMCEVLLPIPSPAKQKEIVKEYNTIINRISLNKQLIQKLEETAQAIYKHWFVDFEFPDENGRPYKSSGGEMEMNLELEKEIPVGWEVNPFTKVLKLGGGGTPNTANDRYWNGEIPFFAPPDIAQSYYAIKTEKQITIKGLENCSSKLYPKDTVFVTARGTVGAIAIAGCEMAMNQSCYAISDAKRSSKYFAHQITLDTISRLKNEAAGAVFSALVTRDFDGQNIIEPSDELILKFDKVIKAVYDSILNSEKEISILSSMKNLLLSKLATIEN